MRESNRYKIGILSSHPIQYYSPLYRLISDDPMIELMVYFCHNQTPADQAKAGFNIEFDWDISLLDGYQYEFLSNRAKNPNVSTFFGCDTPEISEIIKNQKFDAFILQGWYLKSFLQALLACNKTNTPVFVRGDSQLRTNSYLKRILKIPFYRILMSRFDGFLAVGKRSSDYFNYYGADTEKIFFTPHCVDNDFFCENAVKDLNKIKSLKKKYQLPQNTVVFLFVGKLIKKKRPMDFIKALEIAQRVNPDIHGLIVGDGNLKSEILDYIKSRNLKITSVGFINQSSMPEVYSVSDMIVLPSGSGETWGLVVNEAFASGLPALVSEDAGCSENLIKENITGNIFNKGNIQKISELILKYSNNKELLEEMKVNSTKLIEDYSIEVTKNNIYNAINIIKSH